MEFFNPKEDVLDIQLTQYGKYLLSQGKFKPVYYTFHDDGVLYDSQWASFEEQQNKAEERIQEETPYLRPRHVFYGVETSVNQYAATSEETLKSGEVIPMNRTEAAAYSLGGQLGTSELGSVHSPSWEVKFLSGELSGSIEYLTGSSPTQRIPQLEVQLKYSTYVQEKETTLLNKETSTYNDKTAINMDGLPIISTYFEDDTFLAIMDSEPLMLEIFEQNTDFENENFYIEVFEVETVDSDAVSTPGISNESQTETLIPISFIDQPKQVVNNILLDQKDMPFQYNAPDSTYSEYYFTMLADHEISPRALCAAANSIQKRGAEMSIYLDQLADCPDLETTKTPFNIYTSNVSEGDIKEC